MEFGETHFKTPYTWCEPIIIMEHVYKISVLQIGVEFETSWTQKNKYFDSHHWQGGKKFAQQISPLLILKMLN